MGANTSELELHEIEEVQSETHFTQKEIKRLYKRFKKLDRDTTGRITTDEFLNIPELAMNPLAMRVISIFDSNNDDQVSFKQFAQTLSALSVKASKEEKLKFAFKVYDIKEDGVLDEEELFQILKMMVGNNLTPEQLQTIVEKTIQEADNDGDNKLSFEEFCQVLEDSEIETKLSIRF